MKLRRKEVRPPKKERAPDTSWLCRYKDEKDQVTLICSFHNMTKEEAGTKAEVFAAEQQAKFDSWDLTPMAEDSPQKRRK